MVQGKALTIAYIAHTRFPTEKAHGNQMAQVCAALSSLGHQVTLVAPTIRTIGAEDPYAYYGVKKSFAIEHLPVFSALEKWYVPGRFAFLFTMMSYGKSLKRFLHQHKPDVVYMRSPLLIHPLWNLDIPIILELHSIPDRGRHLFVQQIRHCKAIVCLTSLQKKELMQMGIPEDILLVEPDGVSLTAFEAMKHTKNDAPVIGYFGSRTTRDGLDKGVGVLTDALLLLKERGVRFAGRIVAGMDAGDSSQAFTSPKIDPAHVPEAMAACDILVYPAPKSDHPYFQRDTSPLKLYEYLAAKRPVVCAELPPLHDMVSEKEVTFCRPCDPEDMAEKIQWVLEHPKEAQEKVEAGFERVQEHSWEKRMGRILAESGVAKA